MRIMSPRRRGAPADAHLLSPPDAGRVGRDDQPDGDAQRRHAPRRRRPPDNRHPMEKAIAHLSTAYPLVTPEWSAWAATMRPPRLDGRWAVSGYETGKGPVFGQVTVTAQGESGDFTTETTLTYGHGG